MSDHCFPLPLPCIWVSWASRGQGSKNRGQRTCNWKSQPTLAVPDILALFLEPHTFQMQNESKKYSSEGCFWGPARLKPSKVFCRPQSMFWCSISNHDYSRRPTVLAGRVLLCPSRVPPGMVTFVLHEPWHPSSTLVSEHCIPLTKLSPHLCGIPDPSN